MTICFHKVQNPRQFLCVTPFTGISFLIRWTLPIETTTLPTSRWSVDPGRFHLRPVLHVDSLHTTINQPLINSIYDVLESKDINLIIRETGFINTLLTASEKRQ
jgi:hypothetical protein